MSSLRQNLTYILSLHQVGWHQELKALKMILGASYCLSLKPRSHFCYHRHWMLKNHFQNPQIHSLGHQSDHLFPEPRPEHHHTIRSNRPPASSHLTYFKLPLLAPHGSPLCFASLWKSQDCGWPFKGYCFARSLSYKSLFTGTLVTPIIFEPPALLSHV